MSSRWKFLLVLAVFFLSGASGLSLQVLWLRQLTIFFGATAQASAVLLAAFMGGLALGGWIGGRWSETPGMRPLRRYGVVEIGVGIMAVAIPRAFVLADQLLSGLGTSGAAALAGRVVLALVLILPPTILMGATLPLLSRWATLAGRQLSSGTGLLYACNTAGALTGTVLCATLLVPELGV